MNTEADLVARAREGDRDARETLTRSHLPIVARVVARYVRGADADDVAQRAMMRALDRLDGFRGEAPFRSWLSRIATTVSLNHIRDSRREVPTELDEADLVTNTLGTSRLVAKEAKARLRAAIHDLPEKQRRSVELRLFSDMSFAEVGAEMGVSEDSAKMSFHHAMKKLKDVLSAL